MLNIVIFGAPGSGKGTQSDKIIENYHLFHISTGDVLRDNIRRGTELGKTAKGYIDQGQLVPDELIIDILAQVLDENKDKASEGVIFDGFPRTIPQAEALEQLLADRGTRIDAVVGLEVAPMITRRPPASDWRSTTTRPLRSRPTTRSRASTAPSMVWAPSTESSN